MPLDPAERKLRAQLGAHESWARTHDRPARTAPARDALRSRFEREVDPDGVLSPEQRAELARHKELAHMCRMTLAAAIARRKKRETDAPEAV
jgi:hypothetical protein